VERIRNNAEGGLVRVETVLYAAAA
jgi:hypothetical protein